MSRISIKSKADLPADLRPLWEEMRAYGDFEHQAGAIAHRSSIFKHVWGMLTALADEALLPKRYLELCLHTTSLLNRCSYCVSHHAPRLAVEGFSETGAARLLDYHAHPELDETDKLVVEYAIAVTNDWNRTPDELFTRLKAHFTQAQIVEMTWRIALCGACNRFNDTLQIDIEPQAIVRGAAQ
jgi:AhpD family alkylhydroperoxidase